MEESTFTSKSPAFMRYIAPAMVPLYGLFALVGFVGDRPFMGVMFLVQSISVTLITLAGRQPIRVSLADEGLVLHLPLGRSVEAPYAEVVKAQTELFGGTTLSVRHRGKVREYALQLRVEDVERFRDTLRAVAPSVKITGLPTSTVVASARSKV